PLGALVISTFMKVPGVLDPSNFTTDFWVGNIPAFVGFNVGILRNPATYAALWHSIWIVGAAAIVCGSLGLLIGYVVVRGQRSRAHWPRRMTRIVIPIQRAALTTGIILPFISGLKELSLVVMLATPGTDVLSTLSVRLVDYGYQQLANAAVLIIAAVAFAAT